jgi:phosphoglycerate kinase
MNLKSITDVSDLRGKYVLVRASFNVPLVDGKVRNDFRLKRALPTLKFLQDQGAKTIVISHIGREPQETLKPVFAELSNSLNLTWGGSITADGFSEIRNQMNDGEIIICENLRQDEREENNNESLAKLIASYGDLYVNDAFAEAHREHASTFGVAKLLPAYAGITLMEEVSHLVKMMKPESPSVLLLGGAKFETKMPLVEKYLELYDHVFIGGALAHDVLKARGLEMGKSLISEVSLKNSPFLWSEKLLVPIDVVVDGPNGVVTKPADAVFFDEIIYDLGPETVMMLKPYIDNAKTILWNGPFGNYEKGFEEGTEAVARLVADSAGFSVIGGGDTVAAVNNLNLSDKFEFISIGGGSMLTFLEHGETPALKLLSK